MGNVTLEDLPERDCWLTPQWIIDGIEEHVTIDLDPCAGRDTSIGRVNYRGEEYDGLEEEWHGTVFVNPPFSEKDEWIAKAAHEYGRGNAQRGFIVTPDSTDVQSWFHGVGERHGLTDFCHLVWFSEGRVSYIDPEIGEPAGSPSFGTAISMFGDIPASLQRWLQTKGWLVTEARV